MNGFFRCHPLVILLYYITAVGLVVWLGHPVVNGVVFILALAVYITYMGVTKGIRLAAGGILTALVCVVWNPLFNHRGVTVLFQVNDIRFTREALMYGVHMAGILLSSVVLFACLSRAMTAEKIMTLTGKRLPSFSLLFSMVLRFVPKASRDFREMVSFHGNKPSVISGMIGMELEHSMEKSIAMKDRYYGSRKRSSYYAGKFQRNDWICLILMLALAGGICVLAVEERIKVQFFPSVRIKMPSAAVLTGLGVYYGIPLWMWGKEKLLWTLSRRKITGISIRDSGNPQLH